MIPVNLILLLQGLLESHLGLKKISKQSLNLIVKLIVLLGREECDQVVVDLLAEFSGRVVVLVLPILDVLQEGGRVLSSVEGFL